MVTTFIPSRFPGEDDQNEEASSLAGTIPSALSVFTPSQSRKRALIQLIRTQEGRESVLQLIQSTTLLLYSITSSRVQKRQLHLLSESISTLRKFILVGRWLVEGSNAIQEQLDQSTKGVIVRDVNGQALEKVRPEMEKGGENSSESDEEEASAEEGQRQAVSAWKQTLYDGIGTISEYMGKGAETCDLLAFIGGSGMLWRVVGGKLAVRQRKGLERVAVFLGFLSMLFALIHIQQLRARQMRLLRAANQRLLKATDKVMSTDARILLQGHQLLPEQALSNDSIPRSSASRGKEDIQNALPIERILRQSERQVFIEKKKMNHLKLERTAIRSEIFFQMSELIWPHNDHSRIEGYTGIIASMCNISRLAGDSRWR